MSSPSGVGMPTDELLLGILLAVGGVAVGSTLNSELGSALTLFGLAVGIGAYVLSALSAAREPSPPPHHDSPSGGTDSPSEGSTRGDS